MHARGLLLDGSEIVIARDLELLGVVRRLNTEMGGIVATLLEQMVDSQLPAHKLRELALITRDLAAALDERVAEIDPDGTWPRVIDCAPEPQQPR